MGVLFPPLASGRKLNGTNLVIPTVFFEEFWKNFPRHFPLMKAQIKRAYGMGMNCVRVIGDLRPVASGNITQSQYNSYWLQLLEYLALFNMYCYPNATMCEEASGLTVNQIKGIIMPWLQAIEPVGRAIACDILNEGNWLRGLPLNTWPDTFDAIQKAGILIPCTVSTYQKPNPIVDTIYGYNGYQKTNQLLDIHFYGQVATQSDVDHVLAQFQSPWQLVIGEYGIPTSAGASAIRLNIAMNAAVGRMAHARCVGQFQWTLQDYDIKPDNQYGLCDAAGVPKNDYVEPIIRATADIVGPLAPPAPILVEGALLANPYGCSRLYKSMRFYEDGKIIGERKIGMFDVSAHRKNESTYQVSVVTDDGRESKLSERLVARRGRAGGAGALPVV